MRILFRYRKMEIDFWLKRLFLFALFGVSILSVFAQRGKEDIPDLSIFSGDKAGLIRLLDTLSKMDYRTRIKYTRQMRPLRGDYEVVFQNKEFANKIYQYHKKVFNGGGVVIQPNLKGQSEILLWQASREELSKYIHEAVYFPGGYREIAQELNPELIYYRFKYVKPGKNTGSAYDMLVYVSGTWRFFPRPWSAIIK